MAIERDPKRIATIDRQRIDGRSGNWAVFGAENFDLAAEALGSFSDKSLDDLFLETHGGYNEFGSFLRVNDMAQSHPNYAWP